MIALLLLLGCGGAPCASMAAGQARDRCLHARVAAEEAMAPAEVARIAATMEDPMIRTATVLAWARDHRGAVSAADREQLCGTLAERERSACERRLSAAHLSR